MESERERGEKEEEGGGGRARVCSEHDSHVTEEQQNAATTFLNIKLIEFAVPRLVTCH